MNYGRRIHAAGVIGALRIGGRVSQKIIKPPLISAEMIDGIVQTTRGWDESYFFRVAEYRIQSGCSPRRVNRVGRLLETPMIVIH